MFAVGRPSATLCTLALLSMGVMSGTLARPTERETSPLLDITTSIKLGGPILGENIGPFQSGNRLTITCSTKSLGPTSLSWWKDSKQLEAVGSNHSASLELGTLQVAHNGRRFTCRDLVTLTEKSVTLQVVDHTLEILRGHENIHHQQILKVLPGEDLNLTCVVQGYNPTAGSWWEGDEQLDASISWSSYAASSQLQLRAAANDSERRLSCRALEGQLSRTIRVRGKEETKNGTSPSSAKTSKATITATSPSSSTTARDKDLTSPKVSPEKSTLAAGANESVSTPTPDGQGPPVSGTVSPDGQGLPVSGTVSKANPVTATSEANPVTATTTKQPQETNDMKQYFIAGGVAIVFVGLVVVILIFVILKLSKKINKLADTRSCLDNNDLPPLSPLLTRPPPVEGGGDRDHSYYYPDLINNSYYYPNITNDVKDKILSSKLSQ